MESHELVANILNPNIINPNIINPNIINYPLTLAPGEEARVILRYYDPVNSPTVIDPATVGAQITSDADSTTAGTIPPVLDPIDDQSVNEGEELYFPVTASDPDGDTLTLSTTGFPSGASFTDNEDGTGSFSWTPTYDQADTYTAVRFEVSDGNLIDFEEITITVNNVNRVPVAKDDAYGINEDNILNVSAPGVLTNDSDDDLDTLTASLVTGTGPDNGTLILNANGSLSYTPAADFNGTDSFTYEVSDGQGGTATATVTITVTPVNDPPVATDDSATTPEDTPVTIAVLANDSDVDVGDTLSVTSVSDPSKATINEDNTVTYNPDPDFNGPASFTYEVSDGKGGIATATVTIDVTAVNDAPVAGDDSATTPEDTPVTIAVLANDSDIDVGDTLSVISVTQGAIGAVAINPGDITVTYIPDPDSNGTDSFTYNVRDVQGATATATVSITITAVNDPPVAKDDSATTNEDTEVTIPVLANDSDIDVGDTLSVISVTQGAIGTVAFSDSTVTYTPDPNFNGSDSFTYTISDGNGSTDTAIVAITITAVNDAPVAMDDSATSLEDISIIIDVLANDIDVDGSSLSIASVTDPPNGTAVVNPNSTVTYTPESNFNGTDSFTYIITDGLINSNIATVNITVTPVNDPPVADNQSVETYGYTPIDITLTASDIENDPLTYAILNGPTNGTLSGTPPNLTYTPDYDFNGSDSFTFIANDGDKNSEPATVNITVKEVLVATYNNPNADGNDAGTAIAINNSGYVFVTGYSSNGTDNDYATIKYNSDVSPLWAGIAKRYNSGGDDHATAIAVDDSGNIYVTGYSTIKETGSGEDFVTIKYDSSGNEVWTARYDGPAHLGDRPSAITVDSEGSVYVTGYTYRGMKKQHADYSTVKYDSTGKLVWDARYDARKNGNDMATAIAVDATGVYVTGRSELDLGGAAELHYDYYTVKYNTTRGRKIWDARYNGPGNGDDEATDIAILKDSLGNVRNIYVTGKSYGGDPLTGGTGFDYATIRYNPDGTPVWSGDGIYMGAVRYNGSGNGNDEATAIAVNSSGVYVTGKSKISETK